ncbi:MAG: hypothetical protein ISR25_07085 [Candidatus Poseidoniaceae archaeon]|nr:hypothetical protein [Candidatus Poseidoniaceae archaeon]MBL6890237.1 hypothetical protein [Candidatus Poseidoniaceae archaeon]
MALNREVGEESQFWDDIPEELPQVTKQLNDTSGKNIILAGMFYLMAFIMFFTELRIVSLLHCIFGTMFMFFYKIGIQAGDK